MYTTNFTACQQLSLKVLALQEQVTSWALGSHQHDLVGAAVFGPRTHTFHAAVQQSISGSSSNYLLSWPATAQHGSLVSLAGWQPLAGNVHSLHPLPAVPSSAEQQLSDSSNSVAVVYCDGTVALGAQESSGRPRRTTGCRVLHAPSNGAHLAVVCHVASETDKLSVELYDLQVGMLCTLMPCPHNMHFKHGDAINLQQSCPRHWHCIHSACAPLPGFPGRIPLLLVKL